MHLTVYYFSEILCYYNVIRGMEIRWIVDLWCIEKVVLWDTNILVFGKGQYSDYFLSPCAYFPFSCMVFEYVRLCSALFLQTRHCSVTPSQVKENKGVFRFFHHSVILGATLVFECSCKKNLT